MENPVQVRIETFVDLEEKKALVHIVLGNGELTTTSEIAQEIALNLSRAAIGAEAESVLIEWLERKMSCDANQTEAILNDIRSIAYEKAERRAGEEKATTRRTDESAKSESSLIPDDATCPVCKRGGSGPIQSDGEHSSQVSASSP